MHQSLAQLLALFDISLPHIDRQPLHSRVRSLLTLPDPLFVRNSTLREHLCRVTCSELKHDDARETIIACV